MRNIVTSTLAGLAVTATLAGGCTAQRAPLVLIEPEFRHAAGEELARTTPARGPSLELAAPVWERNTRLVEAFTDTTQRW